MTLLNKVKDELTKKGYDFSDESWTGEQLTILYDAVYATEKIVEKKKVKRLKWFLK